MHYEQQMVTVILNCPILMVMQKQKVIMIQMVRQMAKYFHPQTVKQTVIQKLTD